MTDDTTSATGAHLRSIITRIEHLEVEKQTISDDIKEVYSEAKGQGFDVKIIRTVVRVLLAEADDRAEEEAILDAYLAALGMK